jgi:hypothetical protein
MLHCVCERCIAEIVCVHDLAKSVYKGDDSSDFGHEVDPSVGDDGYGHCHEDISLGSTSAL